jgi:hypothetical protein
MMGAMPTEQLSIEDVAARAGVGVSYVRAIDELGVLGRGEQGYAERDVHLVALLHLWEEAGLSRAAILEAVKAGELSLDFLESPGWELPAPLDRTYRQVAEERCLPLELLLAIHESIGFTPPDPDERARPDDAAMADLARVVLDIGGRRSRSGVSSACTQTTSGAWSWPKPTSTPSRSRIRAGRRDRASRS